MLREPLMSDDRRSDRRARLTGVRAHYENASGEHRQGEVTELTRDELFVASETPLAIGKRLSLEISAVGHPGPWPALGRVVKVRPRDEGPDLPAGMLVKIIDIEDAVAAAIEKLVETREPTEPGGFANRPEAPAAAPAPRPADRPARVMPAREKTVMGIGAGTSLPSAPVVTPPMRERTLVGVGLGVGLKPGAAADLREPSLPIDLVPKKSASSRPTPIVDLRQDLERTDENEPDLMAELEARPDPGGGEASEPPQAAAPRLPEPEPEPEPESESESEDDPEGDAEPLELRSPARPVSERAKPVPAPVVETAPVEEPPARKGGSGAFWLVLLVLLIGAAVAGYVFRDRLQPYWHIAAAAIAKRLH
jgi:hypothetical protein